MSPRNGSSSLCEGDDVDKEQHNSDREPEGSSSSSGEDAIDELHGDRVADKKEELRQRTSCLSESLDTADSPLPVSLGVASSIASSTRGVLAGHGND